MYQSLLYLDGPDAKIEELIWSGINFKEDAISPCILLIAIMQVTQSVDKAKLNMVMDFLKNWDADDMTVVQAKYIF